MENITIAEEFYKLLNFFNNGNISDFHQLIQVDITYEDNKNNTQSIKGIKLDKDIFVIEKFEIEKKNNIKIKDSNNKNINTNTNHNVISIQIESFTKLEGIIPEYNKNITIIKNSSTITETTNATSYNVLNIKHNILNDKNLSNKLITNTYDIANKKKDMIYTHYKFLPNLYKDSINDIKLFDYKKDEYEYFHKISNSENNLKIVKKKK